MVWLNWVIFKKLIFSFGNEIRKYIFDKLSLLLSCIHFVKTFDKHTSFSVLQLLGLTTIPRFLLEKYLLVHLNGQRLC